MDIRDIYTRTVIKESVFGVKTKAAYHSGIVRSMALACIPELIHFLFITVTLMILDSDAAMTDVYLSLAVTVLFAAFMAARLKSRRDGFISWLRAFPAEDFQGLCGQAELSGEKYRSLYLLDDYLYLPQNIMMIRYDGITDVSARFYYESAGIVTSLRGRICRRAVMLIGIGKKRKIKIDIGDPRRFENEFYELRRRINAKIHEQREINRFIRNEQ